MNKPFSAREATLDLTKTESCYFLPLFNVLCISDNDKHRTILLFPYEWGSPINSSATYYKIPLQSHGYSAEPHNYNHNVAGPAARSPGEI